MALASPSVGASLPPFGIRRPVFLSPLDRSVDRYEPDIVAEPARNRAYTPHARWALYESKTAIAARRSVVGHDRNPSRYKTPPALAIGKTKRRCPQRLAGGMSGAVVCGAQDRARRLSTNRLALVLISASVSSRHCWPRSLHCWPHRECEPSARDPSCVELRVSHAA